MTPTWKRGSTVQILLDQFTDEEWAAVYPWTTATSEARYPGGTQSLAVTVNETARTILLSADTAGWPMRLMTSCWPQSSAAARGACEGSRNGALMV